MPSHDPTERALLARVAAHTRWSKASTTERQAATAAARKANLDRWGRIVDPEGALPPEERAKRADSAKRAHYSRMALKSARARRLRREADALDAEADQELTELTGGAA